MGASDEDRVYGLIKYVLSVGVGTIGIAVLLYATKQVTLTTSLMWIGYGVLLLLAGAWLYASLPTILRVYLDTDDT